MRPLRPLALIAAALAIVGAAGAAPSEPRSKPNVCTLEQRAIIDAAFRRAEERVAQAIAFLDENPQHEHVTRWFGDSRRKLIRLNYSLIQEALREGRRPQVLCNPPRPCVSFAYARPGQVTVCQRFFDSGIEGQDAHYGILIHEISHIVAGTRDAAYQPALSRLLAEQDPLTAATNADNYEYFVEFLPQ